MAGQIAVSAQRGTVDKGVFANYDLKSGYYIHGVEKGFASIFTCLSDQL